MHWIPCLKAPHGSRARITSPTVYKGDGSSLSSAARDYRRHEGPTSTEVLAAARRVPFAGGYLLGRTNESGNERESQTSRSPWDRPCGPHQPCSVDVRRGLGWRLSWDTKHHSRGKAAAAYTYR